ncbi:MAG: hypothetical protein ACRDRA_05635 [Pseudonocardiaceae bacterium]
MVTTGVSMSSTAPPHHPGLVPGTAQQAMYAVGVSEIVAGIMIMLPLLLASAPLALDGRDWVRAR